MKLAIIGSRSITNDVKVLQTIHNYIVDNKPSVILKSAGLGIDPTIDHYAKANSIDTVNFLPYHLQDAQASFNSKYFFVRTKQILNNADELLAIWDTSSKDTKAISPKTIGDIGKTANNVKPVAICLAISELS